MPFQVEHRVLYAETDRMGVVYHSNYIIFFEIGRTELLRSLGFRYRDMEEQGFILAVTDCGARFIRPAVYDDLVTIRPRVAKLGKTTIRLEYEIFREDELLVTGFSEHAVLTKDGFRPARMPPGMRNAVLAGMDAGRGEKHGGGA
jgi:acyl-CoA thioester hydrolase